MMIVLMTFFLHSGRIPITIPLIGLPAFPLTVDTLLFTLSSNEVTFVFFLYFLMLFLHSFVLLF